MFLKKNILKYTVPAVLLLSFFQACKDDKKSDDPSNSGYSVEIQVNEISATGETDYFRGLELMFPHDNEPGDTYVVECGNKFSKTFTYKNVKEAFGIVSTCMFEEKAADGAEFDFGYTVDYTVYLKDSDGNIIDTESIQKSDEFTADMYPEKEIDYTDFYEYFLYKVTDKGLERIEPEVPSVIEQDLPLTDDDNVRINGNLHIYGSNSDYSGLTQTNEKYLYDNLLARFASASKWNGASVLEKGDFIFLHSLDLGADVEGKINSSLSAGAIIVVDEISSFSQFDAFCKRLNLYNPTSVSTDISGKMFIMARPSHSNIYVIDGNRYGNLCFVLDAKSDDNVLMSDYSQGKVIDAAITRINELLSYSPAAYGELALLNDSPIGANDITSISNATKVYCSGSQTLNSGDYRNRSLPSATNEYSMEYDIWSAFSKAEKRTYYFIHQEFIGSFSNVYVDTYAQNVSTNGCYTIAKVNEWHAESVTLTTTPENATGMQIHRHYPATTQLQASYTSGFSWNLAGEIGIEAGSKDGASAHLSLSGGISFSESYTYPINDVTIKNETEPQKFLKWKYTFAQPRFGFSLFSTSCTWAEAGALSGRSTFNVGQDYLLSFPETVKPKLTGQIDVVLRSACAKCGSECGVRTKNSNIKSKTFNLPYMQSSDFK